MNFLKLPLLLIILSSCMSNSTSVLVGEARDEIRNFERVQLLLRKPTKSYTEIAIVSGSNNGSMAIGQKNQMNAAVEAIKKEAAKLGANAIILENVSPTQVSGSLGQTFSPLGSPGFSSLSMSQSLSEVKGLAIFIEE